MLGLASIAAHAGDAQVHHSEDGMSQLHTAAAAEGVNFPAHFIYFSKRQHRKREKKWRFGF